MSNDNIKRSCNPVNLEDVDYFCRHLLPELASFQLAITSGSKETAARQLAKGSHAIGKSITRAEDILAEWLGQCRLVDPAHPRTNIPTEGGDLLVKFADEIIEKSQKFVADLHALQNNHKLRLATIYSSWLTYGRGIESAFKEKFPDGSITTEFFNDSKYIDDIEKAVREGRADIGITSYPPRSIAPPLRVEPLKDQEMVLVFPSTYSRLPKKNTVSLRDVVTDPKIKFVTYNRNLDIPASRKVETFLHDNNIKIDWNERQTGETISDLLNLLLTKDPKTKDKDTNSFSILPRSAVRNEVARRQLKIYSLNPSPPVWRWGVIYRTPVFRPAIDFFVQRLVALQELD
jgi:DNA-binding transcriptional LysR family regulator